MMAAMTMVSVATTEVEMNPGTVVGGVAIPMVRPVAPTTFPLASVTMPIGAIVDRLDCIVARCDADGASCTDRSRGRLSCEPNRDESCCP